MVQEQLLVDSKATTITFETIPKVTNLTKKIFRERYLLPNRPVVIKDLAKDWVATKKWTFDFFRDTYGDWEVPMYDESYHRAGKGYMKPILYQRFDHYLDIIEHDTTNLRFHNFQVLKRAPELTRDYETPTIMDGFLKFALLFFGGKGAKLNLHYDIDCSHVFLTHFQTQKKVYLYPPSDGAYLYHLPFTNHSHVDVLNPNMARYPAFKYAKGFEAVLEHGETLFIPRLWWHYVYYSEGGYSLALRANDTLEYKVRGVYNLLRLFALDNGMNRLLGPRWKSFKYRMAQEKAQRALETPFIS